MASHTKTDWLLVWEQRPVRGLIPDFRIIRNADNQAVAILDAKYRRFRSLVEDPETATQMALYLATTGAGKSDTPPAAALIYPRTEGLNGNLPSGSLGRGHFQMRLHPPLIAWAVGLESPDDEKAFHASVDRQLCELISILIGGAW